METLTDLIVGGGVSPEIELINPTGDSQKDQKEIEKYNHVLKEMLEIENQINANNDVSFEDFVSMLIHGCNTYGRAAVVLDSYTSYKNIPTTLKFAHARDLAITTFNENSWRLESIQWQHEKTEMINAEDMIYVYNPLVASKNHRAYQYGSSMMIPMLQAAKTMQRLISDDFPAFAKAMASGLFIMTIRSDGNTKESKQREYSEIARGMTPGRPNIIIKNPEDIKLDAIDYKPKITEFRELVQYLVHYCSSAVGLPPSQFTEETSNRSASRSKLQGVMASTIIPLRKRYSKIIARQTYNKWLTELYPDLTDKIRVRMAFSDLKVNEPYDMVELALRVDSRHELTNEGFSKISQIPDYTNLIKPDADTQAGGIGETPHNLQKDNSGKNLDLGKSVNKEEHS